MRFAVFVGAVATSFNAIREDFVDLRDDFGVLRDRVDQGFVEMRGKFDAAAAGQQQLVELLEMVISDRGQRGLTEQE